MFDMKSCQYKLTSLYKYKCIIYIYLNINSIYICNPVLIPI